MRWMGRKRRSTHRNTELHEKKIHSKGIGFEKYFLRLRLHPNEANFNHLMRKYKYRKQIKLKEEKTLLLKQT